MNKKIIFCAAFLFSFSVMLTSCSDLLDTDSELVEYQEDNRLQSPTDSVYSVMGIIYKLQAIADRTVLLGELRGDLTYYTPSATKDLKDIADFTVQEGNAYNRISDYYAVINNCNYYLENINTELQKNGRYVFESEYAAVKAFRAWTYLQLALNYGEVPLVLKPVLTEEEAKAAMEQTPVGINTICTTFINDLKPYVDVRLPRIENIDNLLPTTKFFIPIRALLGDLCLWSGDYAEAARYFHDYLSKTTAPVITYRENSYWPDENTKEFLQNPRNNFDFSTNSDECLCFIPMESNEFYGIKSELDNIYNSTDINFGYAQIEPTKSLMQISAKQTYCTTVTASEGAKPDTIYAPKENLKKDIYKGDLRLCTVYDHEVFSKNRYGRSSNENQTIEKISRRGVTLYRTNIVYLHYAEALNLAGYPQSAFAVLKHGLYPEAVSKYIDSTEVAKAGQLISFDALLFTKNNTQGVHSRGCGKAECDTVYFVMPQPATALANRADTVAYQQEKVDSIISDELALETAFEGQRYYDLMRRAIRRNDNSILATPIANRNGTFDSNIYTMLMNRKNWYLKK